MKRIFTAIVATILLAAIPAHATTFPGLTLIYVAAGVVDAFINPNSIGSAVTCTNQSGQSATVRWRYLNEAGTQVGLFTQAMPNGATFFVGTSRGVTAYNPQILTPSAQDFKGKVAVYSTQSGVFCSAMIGTANSLQAPSLLHMIRFNAHPGAVE